jgi:hypothetical protein
MQAPMKVDGQHLARSNEMKQYWNYRYVARTYLDTPRSFYIERESA